MDAMGGTGCVSPPKSKAQTDKQMISKKDRGPAYPQTSHHLLFWWLFP